MCGKGYPPHGEGSGNGAVRSTYKDLRFFKTQKWSNAVHSIALISRLPCVKQQVSGVGDEGIIQGKIWKF